MPSADSRVKDTSASWRHYSQKLGTLEDLGSSRLIEVQCWAFDGDSQGLIFFFISVSRCPQKQTRFTQHTP